MGTVASVSASFFTAASQAPDPPHSRFDFGEAGSSSDLEDIESGLLVFVARLSADGLGGHLCFFMAGWPADAGGYGVAGVIRPPVR